MPRTKRVLCKTALLIVPALCSTWWLLYKDAPSSNGIGGGGYTLNALLNTVLLCGWALCFTIIMAVCAVLGRKDATLLRENRIFMAVGGLSFFVLLAYLLSPSMS